MIVDITPITGAMLGVEYVYDDMIDARYLVVDLLFLRFIFLFGG